MVSNTLPDGLFLAWAAIFGIGMLGAMSPGPNLIITMRTTLTRGRAHGFAVATGLACGNAVHATFGLVGITVLIASTPWAYDVLRWAGAAFLIWIGVKALFSRHSPIVAAGMAAETTVEPRSYRASMMAGLATNLLNPKVSIFFLALFPQIIAPATPEPVKILYGATMVAVELLWFGSVACFIGSPGIRRRLLRVGPWIDRLTGGALMALGLRLALLRSV